MLPIGLHLANHVVVLMELGDVQDTLELVHDSA